VLQRASLYNIDSIRAAIAVAGDDSGRWEGYRLAALRAAGIGSDANDSARSWVAAAGTFKNIICRAPSAGAYFDLGKVLLKGGAYDEAVKALHVAELLQYQPLPEVLCGLAEAYGNLDNDDSLAMHYMESAIIMGCARPERFLQDSAFAQLRLFAFRFHEQYTLARDGGGGNPSTNRWREFKGNFPATTLPMVIDTTWLENHSSRNFAGIDDDFVDYIPAIHTRRFSRSMDEFFSYAANLGTSNGHTVLMYEDRMNTDMIALPVPNGRTQGRVSSVMETSTQFYIVSYTSDGKVADRLLVAGHMGWREPLKIFRMEPSMDFTVADRDPVSSTVSNIQHYRISNQGRFERIPEALTARTMSSPGPSGPAPYSSSRTAPTPNP
jgi:hypothetical protein